LWIHNTIIGFMICYAVMTMATLVYLPRMAQPFIQYPALFILPLLTMLAIANVPREIHRGKDMKAFLSSCAVMFGLIALVGIGQFPYMVPAKPDLSLSLTIYNAASSEKTLFIMFLISLIGVPLVLSYTVSIYYIFRGKVKLEAMSY
ncbi:MAG: cytochrome d ubiquinol oxidase subunit II, partial [Chlamydiota bacterium]|nr:cytochrome d ubiquinol oxidase subunit II [Chlamydiota bacterium]